MSYSPATPRAHSCKRDGAGLDYNCEPEVQDWMIMMCSVTGTHTLYSTVLYGNSENHTVHLTGRRTFILASALTVNDSQ